MNYQISRYDLELGKIVRIKGRVCEIIEADPIKMEFVVQEMASKATFPMTRYQVFELQRRAEIVSDHQWQSLQPAVRELLAADWNLFSEATRDRASFKFAICKNLDAYDPRARRKAKNIEAAIADAMAKDTTGQKKPSVQTVRRSWDTIYITSGKIEKAMLDQDHRKGRRGIPEGYEAVIAEVENLITEEITSRIDQITPLGELQGHADDVISTKHEAGLVTLHPRLGPDRHIGVHLVRRRFRKRNAYQQLAYEKGRKEAYRISKGIGPGPVVEGPLDRVEADHTPLDQLLIRHEGQDKRPWFTLLKDKWSGAAVGFHISFESPNWFTLHEAIRMGVMHKNDLLSSFSYEFVNDWPVFGVPMEIWVDRESTHRGAALAGLAKNLHFDLHDLPKASGFLKGAIEKALGDFMHSHVKKKPGYTAPTLDKRDPDRAVATMTIEQVREGIVAYLVDDYNQAIEPETGEIRIHRYTRGMLDMLNWKNAPDPEVFGGKAVSVDLTQKGIALEGLRYRSQELHEMWFEAGGNVKVVALIPKFEHDVIRVLSLTGVGRIDAYLDGAFSGLGLTHEEAALAAKKAKESKATPEQKRNARDGRLKQWAADKERSGEPRRTRRDITSPPKKPGHDIAVPPVDAEVSAAEEFEPQNIHEGAEYKTFGFAGPYAKTPPAVRAVEETRAENATETGHIVAPEQGPQFVADGPKPRKPLPRQASVASHNTDTPLPAAIAAKSPPSPSQGRRNLLQLPEGPFKI